MPTSRAVGHKLVLGTKTVAQMNSEVAITAWTKQSDMDYRFNWLPPVYRLSTYPARVERAFLNNRVKLHGNYAFEWGFTNWTNGQLDYLYDNYLASGAADAAVTVKTYTEQNDAVHLTCVLIRPTKANGDLTNELPGGLWGGVRLRFIGGAIIT